MSISLIFSNQTTTHIFTYQGILEKYLVDFKYGKATILDKN